MATHSRILTCGIPWTEEPGRLRPQGGKELGTTEATWHVHSHPNSDVNSLSKFLLHFNLYHIRQIRVRHIESLKK